MIVNQSSGWFWPTSLNRAPTAGPLGQKRRAIVSLTTASGCDDQPSASVKSRPCFIVTFSVRWKCGVTPVKLMPGSLPGSEGWPSMMMLAPPPPPLSGTRFDANAEVTRGNASTRRTMSSTRRDLAS